MAYVAMTYLVMAHKVMTILHSYDHARVWLISLWPYAVTVCKVKAFTAMVFIVIAFIIGAYIVMAFIGMAYIVMAYIVGASILGAYVVMDCIVMAMYSYGL